MINDTGRNWSDLKMAEKFQSGWNQLGYSGSDLTFEHRFHPVRKWRLDAAFPSLLVGIEFDGMGFGHQSIAGRKQDNEKQNAAVAMGWAILRYTPECFSLIRIDEVIKQVMATIAGIAYKADRTTE